MKIIIEYDNLKLKNISNELLSLFSNNYDTLLLNNTISQNEKNNFLKTNSNYFLLSNKINNQNNIEIIYPLKDNNKIAKELNDQLINVTSVSKYYQLRSPNKTNFDYYEIFQNINNNPGIIIKYGESALNNNSIPNIIYQVINTFFNTNNSYIVKSGDSLYAIARKFNTTVDELKRINNLTSNNLSIGQKLIIPNKSNNENTPTPSNNDIYTVKSGDSLYAIARKYNTTVDELKKINNLTSNLLSIGQKLIIPSNEIITYTVTKGDSLYQISKKYNTTVDKIKSDNNLTSNLLTIGQKLVIKK